MNRRGCAGCGVQLHFLKDDRMMTGGLWTCDTPGCGGNLHPPLVVKTTLWDRAVAWLMRRF